MARFDLSNFEWAVIEPLLPNKPHGAPRVDDRRVAMQATSEPPRDCRRPQLLSRRAYYEQDNEQIFT